MTEDTTPAVKEEDDLDGPISGFNRKSLKKMERIPKDELSDDDEAPLARSKLIKKKPSITPRAEKYAPEDDEDVKPPKIKKGPSITPTLKKQEPEDDEDEKPSKIKKRSSITPKVEKQVSEDDEDEKPLKKKEVLKKISNPKNKEPDSEEEDVKPHKMSKKRKRMEENKATGMVKKESVSQKKGNTDKKEKKVYQLPGQKHDPPDMRDPLRIFYETLYEKVPTSEMASTWLMEWGLLPIEEAQKVYAKKLKKHCIQKIGSPAKFTPVKKSSIISVKKEVKVTSKTMSKKSKKNLSDAEDDDEDDDFEFIKKKPASKKKSGNKKASA